MKSYKLTDEEVKLILDALALQSYKSVAPVITKIMDQYNEQENPPEEGEIVVSSELPEIRW